VKRQRSIASASAWRGGVPSAHAARAGDRQAAAVAVAVIVMPPAETPDVPVRDRGTPATAAR
jgi:hypothetical protein